MTSTPNREQWTDDRLDRFANFVERFAIRTDERLEQSDRLITALASGQIEMQEAIETLTLQVSRLEQKQAETDQRSNVLLEEVRFMIRRRDSEA